MNCESVWVEYYTASKNDDLQLCECWHKQSSNLMLG